MFSELNYYETYSVVRIADRTLGRTYYFLMAAIFLFSLWNIYWNKNYFEFETPASSVEMHLIPQGNGVELPELFCPHIERRGGRRRKDSEPEGTLSEPTKGGAERNEGSAERKRGRYLRGCALLDEEEILVRIGRETVMVTTYVEDIVQRRICPQKFVRNTGSKEDLAQELLPCPKIWEDVIRYGFYVSNVESFFLEVRHSMKALTFYDDSGFDPSYALTDDEMSGVAFSGTGENRKIFKRFARKQKNIFTIDELVTAAGYPEGLDSPGSPAQPEVVRAHGVQLQLDLAYNNVRCNGSFSCAIGSVPTTYRYRVHKVPNADFEVSAILEKGDYLPEVKESMKDDGEYRVKRVRRGLYVQVVTGGKIGRFSLQVLLLNVISGLGMATLVVTFTDFLARNVLPKRQLYNKHMVRNAHEHDHEQKQQQQQQNEDDKKEKKGKKGKKEE